MTVAGDPDVDGELLRIRFNVSWLLSSWRCIFGQGCPGVLITGAMEDRGCCQIGVHIGKGADFKRVSSYVKQLTEKDLDADLLADIKANGWYYRETDRASIKVGHTRHTRVVDGACVLANRADGSRGKPGCSLHSLAERLDIHHSDTKPDICWMIPMSITDEYDEDCDQTTIMVDASHGRVWGETTPSRKRFPAYWCVETPDAYLNVSAASKDMVYRTNEVELRKQLGDREYEAMAAELDRIVDTTGRRSRMPGETVAGGRNIIPLLVKDRVQDWASDPDPDTQIESTEALRRSAEYLVKHSITIELEPSKNKQIEGSTPCAGSSRIILAIESSSKGANTR